jgi:hypothetical protein
MQTNNTQFPPKFQVPSGITTYRLRRYDGSYAPVALEYYPERPECHHVAAYHVIGTSNTISPGIVRLLIAKGDLVPETLPA